MILLLFYVVMINFMLWKKKMCKFLYWRNTKIEFLNQQFKIYFSKPFKESNRVYAETGCLSRRY